MASSDDIVPVLTAPPGWRKTCVAKTKKSGTPGRVTVTFTSETTGEEFTSRSKLEKYLKANPNPGNPSIKDFYWGKDDTPRRSSRLGDSPPSKKARTSPASKVSKETNSVAEADKSLEEDFETAVGDEKEKQDEIKDPQEAVMQENQDEKPVEEGQKQEIELEEDFEKEKQDGMKDPQDAVIQKNEDEKPVEDKKPADMEVDSAKEEPHVDATYADQPSGKDDEKVVDGKTQDVPPEDGAKNEMEVDKGTDYTFETQVEVTDADSTFGKAGDENTFDDKAQVAPPEDGEQVDTEAAAAAADQVCCKEGKQVADGEIPTDGVAVTNGSAYEPKL